jgi:fatty acyl-ACP thioesterase A
MPQDIINTHELETITLEYRRECQHDDSVDSLTSAEYKGLPENGSSNDMALSTQDPQLQYLHFLRLSGTGLEINRGRTVWRKLKGKNKEKL